MYAIIHTDIDVWLWGIEKLSVSKKQIRNMRFI